MPKTKRGRTKNRFPLAIQVGLVVVLTLGAYLGVLWGIKGGLISF